ncbi:MAG: AI-2E family transporter, partial [Gammaproteobacteria bacterium]|nr:AI-2E family transporter [Gammaproteobacteria bacterium]
MPSLQPSTSRFVIVSAAIVIVIAGLKAADDMVVPFILSVFIAVISAPPLFWMTRRGVPSWLSITIVIGVIVIVTSGLAVLVSSSVNGFTKALPVYRERITTELSGLFTWLADKGVDLTASWLAQYFDPGMAMQLVANTLSGFGNVLTNSFLILLTVIFILTEAASFPSKLSHMSRDPLRTMERFEHFTDTVKRYMAIKSVMSLLTGISIAIWLAIIGVDFPILWGLIAFFLNFVPNIGSIIAAVPAVLLAFVQLGTTSAVLTAAGYVAMNTIIGNILEPRYMGRGLGLSTLVVFLSLVFWGWVLGPVGMLLSVPLTSVCKIWMETTTGGSKLAILLGPGRPKSRLPG